MCDGKDETGMQKKRFAYMRRKQGRLTLEKERLS